MKKKHQNVDGMNSILEDKSYSLLCPYIIYQNKISPTNHYV